MRVSFSTIAAAAMTTLGVVGGAQANSIHFVYTDNGVPNTFADIVLDLADQGGGIFLATSGTLDIHTAATGSPAVGLYSLVVKPGSALGVVDVNFNNNSGWLWHYDNLVFPGNVVQANGDAYVHVGDVGYLNDFGLLFLGSDGTEVNIYGGGGMSSYTSFDNHFNSSNPGTLTLIPLPTTAGLASVGMFAVAGVRRRRSI